MTIDAYLDLREAAFESKPVGELRSLLRAFWMMQFDQIQTQRLLDRPVVKFPVPPDAKRVPTRYQADDQARRLKFGEREKAFDVINRRTRSL